jgi:NAD(P)-dependent dehydrogenase (short-subunit alcohol dehydrogenase family)
MAGICQDRVVIVTGAGGGIGRGYALAFAAEGAKVVVNDIGAARDGSGSTAGPADAVVAEIRAAGGQAVSNTDDVSSWDGAARLVGTALEAFGDLHVLVNNAGILRDRMMVNLSESDWDAVIAVHLKGTFAPSRHAAAYWRERSKAGHEVDARIINTSSSSGVFGNVGQSNYGAAKAGIAAFTIITSMELARYGITVNAIAPTAMTRMTEDLGRLEELEQRRGGPGVLAPENIAPLAVWLGSSASREVTGRVFSVWGGRITVLEGWVNGPHVHRDGRWTPGELGEVIPELVRGAAPNANTEGERPRE